MKRIVLLIFFCLSYSQDEDLDLNLDSTDFDWDFQSDIVEKKQAYFKGRPCDDTEVRNYAGLPAWKNYGEWLSECDSLEDAWNDSVWAIIDAKHDAERKKEKAKQDSIRLVDGDPDNFDIDFDMDAMWDNTVWVEITEVAEAEVYEIEGITATAGVRGAEAEDEALALLYYRRSMKGVALIDLQKAYGKLRNKVDKLKEKDKNHPDIQKLNRFIIEIERKIRKV